MSPCKRAVVRTNGAAMLGPTNPDPYTIYYTKTSITDIHDFSFAGPFYPLESIVEHIRVAVCAREVSLLLLRSRRRLIPLVSTPWSIWSRLSLVDLKCSSRSREGGIPRWLLSCVAVRLTHRGRCTPSFQTPHPDHAMLQVAIGLSSTSLWWTLTFSERACRKRRRTIRRATSFASGTRTRKRGTC
jgi:hypothetical protein